MIPAAQCMVGHPEYGVLQMLFVAWPPGERRGRGGAQGVPKGLGGWVRVAR